MVKRTKVDGAACILPARHFRLLPCDLIDLTNKGARLDIGALADQLEQPFDFSFDNFRTIRPARQRLIFFRQSEAILAITVGEE